MSNVVFIVGKGCGTRPYEHKATEKELNTHLLVGFSGMYDIHDICTIAKGSLRSARKV
jgi:hypothetical protein